MANAASGETGVDDLQDALAAHVQDQLDKMEAADTTARETAEANNAKVANAIEQTIASAIMGQSKKNRHPAPMEFPQPVFQLAVALSRDPELEGLRDMTIALAAQKRLIPPMLGFYRTLQSRINSAVESILQEFGDVDQGQEGDAVDGGSTTSAG